MRSSGYAPMIAIGRIRQRVWRGSDVAHVQLEAAGNGDDGFRMVAVLEQCVTQCIRAVHEQATEQAVLLLCDPLAAAISADQYDREGGRFDGFQDNSPVKGEPAQCMPKGEKDYAADIIEARQNSAP
jgi:hypothetical protein